MRPAPPVRCPACDAAARPGAPWCTQCYSDLRPPRLEPAVPGRAPAAVPPVPSAEGALPRPAPHLSTSGIASGPVLGPRTTAAAPAGPADAGWPCAACGTRNALDAAACTACGSDFLSGVRAAGRPRLVLPGVGDVVAMTRAGRAGVATALGAGLVLCLVLLAWLLGGLLA